MPGTHLFTNYHIKRHLFYIGSLLQIFAFSRRTVIFYEAKIYISGKECEVSEVALWRRKEERSNHSGDLY